MCKEYLTVLISKNTSLTPNKEMNMLLYAIIYLELQIINIIRLSGPSCEKKLPAVWYGTCFCLLWHCPFTATYHRYRKILPEDFSPLIFCSIYEIPNCVRVDKKSMAVLE